MNNAEYVQLRLFRNDMNHIEPDSRYTNSFITLSNFQENVSKLQKVIDFLHQDLVWDGIPTIDEVNERLVFGSVCMLWEFENKVVGWSWLNNECISIDWKSEHTTFKSKTEQYGGGAFLSKQNKPEPEAGYKFYRYGIENMFKYFNKETLYLYADDWNRASSILCYKIGFTKFNFLK
tara:strand:- start:987 stop:1517 length:531 start_codon:yes stop_codon:yes gene_type:complete